MKRQRERTEAQCCYLGALWVVMHLIASIRSGIYSMYRSYDSWTYILIAAYVIVLVLFNIWLFLWRGKAKWWSGYWMLSGLTAAFMLFVSLLHVKVGLWILPLLILSPYWLLETLLYTAMGSKGAIYVAFGMLLLSAAEFLYNHYLIRRAEKGAFDESLEL